MDHEDQNGGVDNSAEEPRKPLPLTFAQLQNFPRDSDILDRQMNEVTFPELSVQERENAKLSMIAWFDSKFDDSTMQHRNVDVVSPVLTLSECPRYLRDKLDMPGKCVNIVPTRELRSHLYWRRDRSTIPNRYIPLFAICQDVPGIVDVVDPGLCELERFFYGFTYLDVLSAEQIPTSAVFRNRMLEVCEGMEVVRIFCYSKFYFHGVFNDDLSLDWSLHMVRYNNPHGFSGWTGQGQLFWRNPRCYACAKSGLRFDSNGDITNLLGPSGRGYSLLAHFDRYGMAGSRWIYQRIDLSDNEPEVTRPPGPIRLRLARRIYNELHAVQPVGQLPPTNGNDQFVVNEDNPANNESDSSELDSDDEPADN